MTDTEFTGDEAAIETETLPLDAWHRAKGGRMVEFAGYWMPIQYEGIMAEHLWVRENAGLFDVSHMGQLALSGDDVAAALETLVPGDISALKPGRMRYSLLLGEDGGILDDLMITNEGSMPALTDWMKRSLPAFSSGALRQKAETQTTSNSPMRAWNSAAVRNSAKRMPVLRRANSSPRR